MTTDNTQPVDVLAVMDRALNAFGRGRAKEWNELSKARAAVAELIEIQRRLVALDLNVNGEGSELARICDDAAAALARVGGGE